MNISFHTTSSTADDRSVSIEVQDLSTAIAKLIPNASVSVSKINDIVIGFFSNQDIQGLTPQDLLQIVKKIAPNAIVKDWSFKNASEEILKHFFLTPAPQYTHINLAGFENLTLSFMHDLAAARPNLRSINLTSTKNTAALIEAYLSHQKTILKETNSKLQESLDNQKSQRDQLVASRSSRQLEAEDKKAEQELLELEHESLIDLLKAADESLTSKATMFRKEKEERVATLESQISSLKTNIAELENEIDSMCEKIASLNTNINEARNQFIDLHSIGVEVFVENTDISELEEKNLNAEFSHAIFHSDFQTLDLSTSTYTPKQIAERLERLPNIKNVLLNSQKDLYDPFSLHYLEERFDVSFEYSPSSLLTPPKKLDRDGDLVPLTPELLEKVLKQYPEIEEIDLTEWHAATPFDVLYFEETFSKRTFHFPPQKKCIFTLYDEKLIQKIANRFPDIFVELRKTSVENEIKILELLKHHPGITFQSEMRLDHLLSNSKLQKKFLLFSLLTNTGNNISNDELMWMAVKIPSLSKVIEKILHHREKEKSSDILALESEIKSAVKKMPKAKHCTTKRENVSCTEYSYLMLLVQLGDYPKFPNAHLLLQGELPRKTPRSKIEIDEYTIKRGRFHREAEHFWHPEKEEILKGIIESGHVAPLVYYVSKIESYFEFMNLFFQHSNGNPLKYAAKKGHGELLAYLYEHFDFFNSSKGVEILQEVIADQATLKFLIENVKISDRDLFTLLEGAVVRNNFPSVQLLLDSNPSLLTHDVDGAMLLKVMLFSESRIEQLLRQHGAKINLTNLMHMDEIENLAKTNFSPPDEKNGVEALFKLFDAGLSPNTKVENSRTFMFGSVEDDEKILTKLISLGGNIHAVNDLGRTPIFYDAEAGHVNRMATLIQHGAKINLSDHEGKTPLLYATEKNQIASMKILIAQGAKIDQPDCQGRTPLSYAAENGSEETLEFLLSQGAKANQTDCKGRTPLSYAAKNGENIETLIKHGAAVDQRDCNGRTPLSYAGTKAIDCLILHHATIDLPDWNGRTPLSYAAEAGFTQTVSSLIHLGAQVDLPDSKGRTPASYAAEYAIGFDKESSTLGLLIEKGSKLNQMDHSGRTLLSYAAEAEKEGNVEILIENGVDLNLPDKEGRTPLSYAAQRGSYYTIEILITHGVNLNLPDHQGRTPLSYASNQYESDNLPSLLLKSGSEVDRPDVKGRTPLSYACEAELFEHASDLINFGADVNKKDKLGKSPLDYAQDSTFRRQIEKKVREKSK